MDYGTDIHSDWSFNEGGDLNLISDADNLFQAIVNRLTCDLNTLGLFYMDYGCLLDSFVGWRNSGRTLDFIKLELENRLNNEERLENIAVDLSYNSKGYIDIKIDLVGSTDYVHTINLKLDEDGVGIVGD